MFQALRLRKDDSDLFAFEQLKKSNLPKGYREIMFPVDLSTIPTLYHRGLSEVHALYESNDYLNRIIDYPRFSRSVLLAELEVWKKVSPKLIKNLSWSVAFTLEYLHDQRYTHRDLNPNRILIKSREKVLVSGYSLKKDTGQTMEFECAEGEWRPPRVDGAAIDHLKDDAWCFGAILFFTLTGEKWLTIG